METAQAIATSLSRKDHEITVRKGARGEIARRKSGGDAMLSLHVVRPLGSAAFTAPASLALLEDPSRTRLDVKATSPREATRSMRVAVVGEMRVAGGKAPEFVFGAQPEGGWDLGATAMRRKK